MRFEDACRADVHEFAVSSNLVAPAFRPVHMKRLVGTAVGAGALLLTLTACAGSQQSVGFGGQPPSAAPSASAGAPAAPGKPNDLFAKPPAGGTAVPQNRITTLDLPNGQPSLVWTTGNGSTVGFYGREGGCTHVHGEVAAQTATGVTIMMVEQVPAKKTICTMDLRFPPVTVQLTAPLADRPVTLQHQLVKVDH